MTNAIGYIGRGHSIDGEGWVITLCDYRPECTECPVAIHRDTGSVYPLEYTLDDEPGGGSWSTDWTGSPLDTDWGNPAALITTLGKMYRRGQLRAQGAIHGLPGSSPLGALLC